MVSKLRGRLSFNEEAKQPQQPTEYVYSSNFPSGPIALVQGGQEVLDRVQDLYELLFSPVKIGKFFIAVRD